MPSHHAGGALSNPLVDLRARLRGAIAQLSPAERRVAELMSSDPGRVAQMTVTEAAAQASSSPATVVRTAKRLGFDGYPQLRYALAAEAGRADSQHEAQVPGVADIVASDNAATVLAKLAAFESGQVLATAQLTSPEALEDVAGRIAGAPRCYTFGIGSSGLVAQDLVQKVTRIGLAGSAHIEHDSALVAASLLGKDDVVIAVSHSGETPSTIEPVREARSAGAFTAAITGSARSTLARTADQVLLTAGVEFGPRSAAVGSRTSQLLVVDALFVRIAQLTPESMAALQVTHDVVARARRHGR